MGTIYPTVLADLQSACARYRRQSLTLEELKAAIWKAAMTIVASDERELRELLQQAEGELDVLQFTESESVLFERTLEVVSRIDAALKRWQ